MDLGVEAEQAGRLQVARLGPGVRRHRAQDLAGHEQLAAFLLPEPVVGQLVGQGMATELSATSGPPYERHHPETTALYEVVRDNLETLYGAISEGALGARIPKHARRELEAYLGCGLLCWRGFVRLRCPDCGESRVVAFSCKSRGFCPACLGRRMNATAAGRRRR